VARLQLQGGVPGGRGGHAVRPGAGGRGTPGAAPSLSAALAERLPWGGGPRELGLPLLPLPRAPFLIPEHPVVVPLGDSRSVAGPRVPAATWLPGWGGATWPGGAWRWVWAPWWGVGFRRGRGGGASRGGHGAGGGRGRGRGEGEGKGRGRRRERGRGRERGKERGGGGVEGGGCLGRRQVALVRSLAVSIGVRRGVPGLHGRPTVCPHPCPSRYLPGIPLEPPLEGLSGAASIIHTGI